MQTAIIIYCISCWTLAMLRLCEGVTSLPTVAATTVSKHRGMQLSFSTVHSLSQPTTPSSSSSSLNLSTHRRSTAIVPILSCPIKLGFRRLFINDCRSHSHIGVRCFRPDTPLYSFNKTSSLADITTCQQQQKQPQSSSSSLKTLAGSDIYAAEEIIKKSRFIGYAAHCISWKEAQSVLDTVRKDHPKARHVCFGFLSSSSSSSCNSRGSVDSNPSDYLEETKNDDCEVVVGTERCSDDGEPTGTAGMPILSAIKGEGLSDVVCIVVRYFGGVKLGAGGLIRAYGNTARLVLRSASTVLHVPQMSIRLSTMASNSGAIYAALSKHDGTASDEAYTDLGELIVTITCTEESVERMKQDIVDGTRGGVTFY